MNYIKKHAKQIITTFILSFILAYLLSLIRPYPAFGGEDLIPITVIFIWIFKFIDEKRKEKKMIKEHYESKLFTYRVEFTGKNNDNIYLQEWFRKIVKAENGKQAIEFLKRQLKIMGNNPENYIYTVKGIETVCLFWSNEPVKVFMGQKPVFDEETDYYLYKTEDGRWIAYDDTISEWILIRG